MASAGAPLCATASDWLVPLLEPVTEAVVIIRVDDESGEILYQNPSARGLLHHSEETPHMRSWAFESGGVSKEWPAIAAQIVSAASCSGQGGTSGACPVAHSPKTFATAKIRSMQVDTPPKELSIRFQTVNKTIACPCGCGSSYAIAYMSSSNTGQSSDGWESHQRLQATMDASFDPMFTIDQSGIILMTNKAAVKLFGYDSVDDLFGQNISIICGKEHAAQHDEYLRRYLTTGVTKIMGTKRRVMASRKDGSEFPVELGLVELPTSSSQERYFSGFVRDLTELEQQQSELMEQTQLTQTLLNASFDPMIQIDQRGVIQIFNEATVNLFGYSKEELTGANISILCGGDHGAHHDEYLQHYLETGQKRVIGRKRPTIGKRKDGTEFPIELGIQQVRREQAGEWAFCGFIRDLTSQQKMKESLQRQGKLIQNQFFGTPDSSDAGSATSNSVGGRPRRQREHHHTNTAPA